MSARAEEIAKACDVVAAVEIHDRQHEQELREREYNGILRTIKDLADNLRHRQPEELLKEAVHRDVHRRQQEGDRPDEAMLHLGDALLDRIFLRRGFGRRLLALDRGAVTSVDDSLDDGRHARLRLIVFELHAVRQQIDADIFRAINLRDGFLHTGRACRTRHARDRELFFLHLGFQPPWWLLGNDGSFHDLLQRRNELIDYLIMTSADVIDDARLDVLCEQFLVERIERRLDGADLREDVDAVAVILDHLADAADLSLDAPQARDEALVFLAVLVAVLVLDTAATGVLLCTRLSHSSRLTFLIFT